MEDKVVNYLYKKIKENYDIIGYRHIVKNCLIYAAAQGLDNEETIEIILMLLDGIGLEEDQLLRWISDMENEAGYGDIDEYDEEDDSYDDDEYNEYESGKR